MCFPIANYKHFAPLERETLICVETNGLIAGNRAGAMNGHSSPSNELLGYFHRPRQGEKAKSFG
jgi:hypothetical protein